MVMYKGRLYVTMYNALELIRVEIDAIIKKTWELIQDLNENIKLEHHCGRVHDVTHHYEDVIKRNRNIGGNQPDWWDTKRPVHYTRRKRRNVRQRGYDFKYDHR